MTPRLVALLAALAAYGAACFAAAWQVQSWRWQAADGRRAAADAEAQRLQRRSMDDAAGRHEAERARIAAQRRTITMEVERVITVEAAAAAAVCALLLRAVRVCCADHMDADDGLHCRAGSYV